MRKPAVGGGLRGSPTLAALLSFIWPGLGHAYTGHRRLAVAFAIPALAVAAILLYQARQGLTVLVARFIDPAFAFGALVVVVLMGALRVAAVAHAYSTADPARRRRPTEIAALCAIVALIVGMHAIGAYAAYADYQTVFNADLSDLTDATADPGASPEGSAPPTPKITIAPAVTPVPGGRVTILLTGVDSYPGRGERLYDSIMVASIDQASHSVAMISIPRDSIRWPYYFNPKVQSTFKINALVTYAQHGWFKTPDDPFTSFVKEISYIVGIPINYYAVVDLAGFVKLVDMVGGVDVNNASLIDDPTYDWLDARPLGFRLTAGPHHLNGKQALAYVRSRHGSNNNDYVRASRQQEVLVSLERRIASPTMIARLPDFMATVSSTIRTTFPANQVADMVAFGETIPKENITQVVLAPSTYMTANCLRLDRISNLSVKLFGADSRYSGKTQANVC